MLFILILILIPIAAIIASLKVKGRFWKASLVCSIISIIVLALFIYLSQTCTDYFCGLRIGVQGMMYSSVIAIVSLILALIRKK